MPVMKDRFALVVRLAAVALLVVAVCLATAPAFGWHSARIVVGVGPFWCASAAAKDPTVPQCPEPWLKVPPRPPQ